MRLALAITVSAGLHLTSVIFSIASGDIGDHKTGRANLPAGSGSDRSRALRVSIGEVTPAPRESQSVVDAEPQPSGENFGSNGSSTAKTKDETQTQRRPNLGDVTISVPGPRYYKTSELDVRPQFKTQTEPEFPLQVDPGIKGVVLLRLFVSDQGEVEDVVVVRSQPEGVFDQAALIAFKKARLVAGMLAGKSVRSQLLIEVLFESAPLKK